ncbi:DUF969 domain-containing protein [Candidatus Cetobacterium colombiensis]|uniref:DUF969 domain-containing protein n=1 Tax=Candidatus Cetobacterium colombiensis TaxID=3073100 RepID=A0ABU4W8J4_9FUSO|nr:DUF969 domain-containing protein [Candidatus Cetobacterium colombiensis]MDX8335833.1 DUF969 domain-containing protein [Candidatus Cetobacterium colombiensis]
MIKLIGVLIILIGFVIKLDTIAVVLIAGIATGLVAGIDFVEVLNILGTAFVQTRYMTLLLLTLSVVGILERNGLRERASICISKLKGATAGKVLSIYVTVRMLAAVLSMRLGGHVQFIRPLIYPMAKGAIEKDGVVSEELDEDLKGITNASENYANFFGQNVFVASSGVLLIVGTLQELGVKVEAYAVAKASIPVALITLLLAYIQYYRLDRKIKKLRAK